MRNYIRLIGILTIINICSSAWYSDWLYRKSITNNSAAGGDLTNFPLLLVISNDNDLSNHASSNGYDILFTLKNGTTKLAHEIEYYASGTLIAWIKIPVLSATEQDSNVIYMYYGKSGAENQQNSNNVYDSDYYMVHHLSETAGTHYDSTVNARNGTWNFVSGTSTMNTNGKIGGADYFDGSGDYIKLPLVTNTNITVETWVYRLSKDAVTADVGLGSWRYSPTMSSNDGFEHARFHINSDQCRFQVVTSNTSTSVKTNNIAGYTFSDSTLKWIYVAGTYDSVSGKVRLWIDGTNAATQSAGAGDVMTLFSGNTYMRIGSSTVNTGDFHGFVDEVKLSVIARSSNWILNSYSNQVNPTTFRLPPGSVENFPGV
ncbi:MAG TPA: hypothetical protein DC049_05830, partial [Spirochaetia bacterium]|nr:hypothetical protein [Spirochaetia bacterium]